MKNVSNIGKLLVIIGVGFFVFGIVLMIFDDGRTLTSLAIPFIFLSFLVIMASILFIGEFNKKSFHINNFMFLFLLFTFNSLALFGAEFGGGAGPETFFAIGISYAIWGIYYFLQFIRPNKTWRISLFLLMVISLFFWETGLGSMIGIMIFY